MHGLKSDRNARRVMEQLSDKVNVIKGGENVYYLNAKGREVVNCQKVRKSTGNVEHFLMRNALYIGYGMPASWKNEIKITSKGLTKKDTVTNVADALFTLNGAYHIVEVDNTQTMAKNKVKMEKYRRLIERKAFGDKMPNFVWVTKTPLRQQQITELCKGLNVSVFLHNDLK